MTRPQEFLSGRIRLYAGDCLDVLDQLDENSIDAVVTDPPYFLTSISKRFSAAGAAPAQFGRDGSFSRLSGGFMNARWDDPGEATGITVFEAWLAGFIAGEGCFRVQAHKGGKYYACAFTIHLRQDDAPILEACREKIGGRIAFGEGRTSKLGIISAPDVRWIVETIDGCLSLARILDKVPLFAKKAADYALWRRALHLWSTTPKGSRWHGPRDVTEMKFIHEQLQKVKRWDHGVDLSFDPFVRPDQYFHYRWATKALRIVKPGGYIVAFSSTRTYHRMACAAEDAGWIIHPMLAWVFATGFPKATRVHLEGWEGWRYGAQALKPAFEPIMLCQKPFSEKTGTENIRRWGTGALNIDGCRIAADGEDFGDPSRFVASDKNLHNGWQKPHKSDSEKMTSRAAERFDRLSALGRWPANILHDGSEEVVALFPDTKGQGGGVRGDEPSQCHNGVYSGPRNRQPFPNRGDSGSAARFFYSAKADKQDRIGSKHPTVKPVNLMSWLCRLITPPGGIILDPFAGSGSTGEAAWREGFTCHLIEREDEYRKDIARRMELCLAGPAERARESVKARGLDESVLPLFARDAAE